ncbi:MAG: hypothetical protein WCC10_14325 [Tumebacillaceae bacterium]
MNMVRLSLYLDSSSEVTPLVEVQNKMEKVLDADFCTISIVAEGHERLADRLSLGPLSHMIRQFEHAISRLKKNETALIRSGVFDFPEGVFLLLEPDGVEICVSIIEISTPELHYFTPGEIPYRTMLLYGYVKQQRDRLVLQARELSTYADLNEVIIDREEILTSFQRDVRLGKQILSFLE